jgi:short subunit dehydrogenase-like uncharacterized protein
MGTDKWMLYGANGFTGRLIAKEAVRRGHRPLLAGRSQGKLAPIAERLGLNCVPIDLHDQSRLANALDQVDLVLNAAGPFVHTALALVAACLRTGTSYVDISGEPLVLEQIFAFDQQAREKGIAILPGAGFNVLASDCLALYVVEGVAHPTFLEIATRWITEGTSPGSMKTMIETLPLGTLARREGQVVKVSEREGSRRQHFLSGESIIFPVPLGDLATAYRTTEIPDITTYTAVSERTARSYSLSVPIMRMLYSFPLIRRMASKWVDLTMSAPEDPQVERGTAQVWALVRNEEGVERQAWLETVNSYQFTAQAAVMSVEKLLGGGRVGVLTPAVAFGADFVLEIPGTRRVDDLDGEKHQG